MASSIFTPIEVPERNYYFEKINSFFDSIKTGNVL